MTGSDVRDGEGERGGGKSGDRGGERREREEGEEDG